MKKLLSFLAMAVCTFAQTPSVQFNGSPGDMIAPVSLHLGRGAGKSIVVESLGNITVNTGGSILGAGTFDFSSGTLTLATGQVGWAKVNKSGSSLADLATRSASDLSSGTVPLGRLYTTLGGYGITDAQPLNANLTNIAGLTTTSYGRSVLSLADATAGRVYFGVRIGTDVQAWSANLDTWSGKTPFAGTLAITTAKTLTATNTLTLSGTDSSTLNIGTGGTLNAGAYALGFSGATVNTINGATVFGPDDSSIAIVNSAALSAAFEMAATNRVAIVSLGDSTMTFNAQGWAYYFTKWFANAYGCYGTGLNPPGVVYPGVYGAYLVHAGRNNTGASTGAPTALDNYAPQLGEVMQPYDWIPSGSSQNVQSFQHSFIVEAAHPMGIAGNVTVRLTYGTSLTGSTTFTPSIRRDDSPYNTLATGPAINPVTGSNTVVDYTINLAADAARTYPIAFTPTAVGGTLNGPYIAYNFSAENSDKTNGIAQTCLLHYAGSSLRTYLATLNSFGDTAGAEFFRQIRLGLTSANKTVVVPIIGGVNDRNETLASIGPHPQMPGDSAAAFSDNLQGIVAKVQAWWVAAGGTATTIHFTFVVSHPYNEPEDSKLLAYSSAANALARYLPNASSITQRNIRSYRDYVVGSWFDSGGNAHLSAAGFDGAASALVNQIHRVSTTYQPLNSNLTAIAALTTTTAGRSLLTASALTAAGLSLTNGGNIDALGAVASNGLLTRTASGTYAARTITGTASQITVTNGDGVSGNPTLSLPTTLSGIDTITSTTSSTTQTVGPSGSGTLLLRGGFGALTVANVPSGAAGHFDFQRDTSLGYSLMSLQHGVSNTTGNYLGALKVLVTYNQASGTGSNTDVTFNRIETAISSGAQLLTDWQVNGVSKASISRTGAVTASTFTSAAGATWNLGAASATTITSPDKSIKVTIGGTDYYIPAKLTNN